MSAFAVVMDCDGFLAPTEDIFFEALFDVLKRHGVSPSDEIAYASSLNGLPKTEKFKQIREDYFTATGKTLPDSFETEVSAEQKRLKAEKLIAIEGIHELIGFLQDNHVPFCVGSNSTQKDLGEKLEALGLHSAFDSSMRIALDDVGNRGKPWPDIHLEAARRMGYSPQHCLGLEDSQFGIMAVKAAGMIPIGFSGGYYRMPDATIQSLYGAGAKEVHPKINDIRHALERRLFQARVDLQRGSRHEIGL